MRNELVIITSDVVNVPRYVIRASILYSLPIDGLDDYYQENVDYYLDDLL